MLAARPSRKDSRLTDLNVTLNVRVTAEFRQQVDAEAAALGMNRSEFVISTLLDRMNRTPRGRTVVQQKFGRIQPGSMDQRFCAHPLQLRSEKRDDGSSRCLACNVWVFPLR